MGFIEGFLIQFLAWGGILTGSCQEQVGAGQQTSARGAPGPDAQHAWRSCRNGPATAVPARCIREILSPAPCSWRLVGILRMDWSPLARGQCFRPGLAAQI